MARTAITVSLSRILCRGPILARCGPSSKALTIDPRSIKGAPGSQDKSPIDEALVEENHEVSRSAPGAVKENLKGIAGSAASATEQVESTTETAASQAIGKAQDFGDRAKQSVHDAWGSAKVTAERVKETDVDKPEDAEQNIKETAKIAERAMNTKNRS